ncbi:MAG: aspartate kinase, partial [Chitinophagaceae bacterium]|nr:aspartate kinase [Chitinophagaceae bacterium]
MQVLKFGGSSVSNAGNISKVVSIIQLAVQKQKTIVVLSALGGATDLLLECGHLAAGGDESYKEKLRLLEQRHLEAVKQLIPVETQSGVLSLVKTRCNEIEDICNGVFLLGELSPRTKDRVVSYGELISSQIVAARLSADGLENTWVDARELISTNSHFTYAAVNFTATDQKIQHYFAASAGHLFIIPGFIASDATGATTTLGRGGSDYTAAILAGALNASSAEIWTDVSGMMTADPRLVSNAKIIPHISYQEAMELSHFGAKVIYPPTIQPVMNRNIPVWVKNTFAPDDHGTLIQTEAVRNGSSIRGISSINKIALLSLEGSGMVGVPGFSKRLFEA